MRIAGVRPAHLTYCTNIHPGETWPEVRANVERHVREVKARMAPDHPFGVGLRLGAEAARALAAPAELEAFRSFLQAAGLYVFTLNGFPHGSFHGTRVKEQVYRPDWLEDERLAYTDRLAGILAKLLPSGGEIGGSISTVPGCFRDRGSSDGQGAQMAERLVRHAATLWRIREDGGPLIALALEPEPACLLETSADATAFFGRHIFGRTAVAQMAALTGLGPADAAEALRAHVGVCLDACHAAVEHEDPLGAVRALQAAGISIAKIQLSAGLRIQAPDAEGLAALARFAEGVYLHQVVVRSGGELRRYVDLDQALADAGRMSGSDAEWRVHFHVPIFRESLGAFASTQPVLADLLALQAREAISPHLEVETYTWDVLPEEHRGEPVVDAVVRELRWVVDRLKLAA